DGDHAVGIVESRLAKGAFELASDGFVNFGLPVRDIRRGETVKSKGGGSGKFRALDAFVPKGFPIAYHPKIVSPAKRQIGRAAGGGKVLLAEDPHVTIIGDDNREFVYPDAYPYSAVCKLHIESRLKPGDTWGQRSHASGFLVGKRTLVTSGHAHPDTAADGWRIEVIPACWGGRSVFGMGYVTYVRSCTWWHSDAGNDIMVCELYDPIGEDLGYFGAVSYDSDWEDLQVWEMCGFPFDRSLWAMSRQRGIAVRDDDDGDDIELNGETYDTTQVENDADEASGASGSPLFAWFDGDVRAVGVHSGVQRDWTISGTETLSCSAGGEGFVEILRWARGAWG
ncbi:MAG: hypothetical protein KGI75_24180, partial [Rhizobiaceae bacterium]|nr:hypothetical protein [Rhizobiaceae bacterium]